MRRRTLIGGGLASLVALRCDPKPPTPKSFDDKTVFDFIVVGSGAGGGPLAANLALRGYEVLLLEAGEDRGDTLTYQVPALHPQAAEDPAMRWDYFVKHYEPGAEPAGQDSKFVASRGGILYPRAGTLGGCTAHNTMVVVKPHAHDWDTLAELTGDDGWSFDSMERYFKRLERCRYVSPSLFGDDFGHGYDGWLETHQADSTLALRDFTLLEITRGAVAGFARSQGHAQSYLDNVNATAAVQSIDVNRPGRERDQTEGVVTAPMSTDGRARRGPREFIRDVTARNPDKLVVRTHALASRVLFSDEDGAAAFDDAGRPRATGVEYLQGAHLYEADPAAATASVEKTRRVFARHEVILCAGAFNTPQLLKLSGIGPKTELASLGIPLVVDLPAVGGNLQDRYELSVVSDIGRPLESLAQCTLGEPSDPCIERWRHGEGPYTSNGVIVGVIARSAPQLPDPDLFVFASPGAFEGYWPGYSKELLRNRSLFSWAVLKAHTSNANGTVRLKSTDPRAMPEINFAWFTNSAATEDLDALVQGVKLARQIGAESKTYVGQFDEVWPGEAVASDAQLRSFIQKEAWGHHASCSCPMGPDGDASAALNGQLQIQGAARLRVVDASVFPRIPGFFIVTSIYMVSERAVDLLDDAAKARG